MVLVHYSSSAPVRRMDAADVSRETWSVNTLRLHTEEAQSALKPRRTKSSNLHLHHIVHLFRLLRPPNLRLRTRPVTLSNPGKPPVPAAGIYHCRHGR